MITVVELSRLAAVDGRHKSQYVNRIRIYWCRKMESRGKCNLPCSSSTCAAHLKNILSGIRTEEVRAPAAVLVWRIRNEIASMDEQQEAPCIVMDKLLGTPLAQDPIQAVLAEIGGD
jgi:hypothetical protein